MLLAVSCIASSSRTGKGWFLKEYSSVSGTSCTCSPFAFMVLLDWNKSSKAEQFNNVFRVVRPHVRHCDEDARNFQVGIDLTLDLCDRPQKLL
jgi:hypothetical protein